MTSHRTHDRIEAAKEAARARMVNAALRGSISPPEPPVSALGEPGYYAEREPPEKVKLDPAAGRSGDEEDAWRQVHMSPAQVALRDIEEAALRKLDELREDKLREDEIPTRSSEPVRPDPRPDWRDY